MICETWNVGPASVCMEWQVCKTRIDDSRDHAGSAYRWGPDVGSDNRYPQASRSL